MSALIQNTKIAFSKGKQTAFGTPNTTTFWSFTKLNGDLVARQMGTEDDAAEYGKGDEFPRNVYATAWDTRGSLSRYLGSNMAAFLFAFGFGNTAVTGSGPYTYTSSPMNTGATGSLQLPQFTYVEQIPFTDVDTMAVDCVIDNFSLAFNSGPGRQNSQFQIGWIGSGKLIEPSGVTVPALTNDTLLPAGLMALTVNGTDYVANKDILSVSIGWQNNLRANEGYFPGSGFQTAGNAQSGAIRGRLEIGPRVLTISFTARKDSTSAQYALYKALTSGAFTLALNADSSDSLGLACSNVIFRGVTEGDTNGIASVTTAVDVIYNNTTGLISSTVVCPTAGICQ